MPAASPPIRVLEYAASSRIGGVETYVLRLTDHLRAQGHSVTAVTRRDVPLATEFLNRGVSVHSFHRGGRANLVVLAKLIRLIKAEKIDVVHTHIFSANRIGALAAALCKVPSVARVPAAEGIGPYGKSTYVTAVSRNVARHVHGLGLPAERIRVFYNGVDHVRFADLPDRKQMRASWNLPLDAYVVACVASLTERKGQRFLVEALGGLPPNTHILLAGEGNQLSPLKEQAAQQGVANRVHFIGFQSDVRPVLAAADVVALPSLLEGLPNAVLEAQAAGVPVVATAIAGTPEIVRPNQTGLLVAPESTAELTAALQKLLDAETRVRLGLAGQQMARTEFDGGTCLRRVEEFLVEAVQLWREGRRVPPDLSWKEGAP